MTPEEREALHRIGAAFEISVAEMLEIAAAIDASWIFDELVPSPYPDDEQPNDDSAHILGRLGRAGWIDVLAGFRDSGITMAGFGAVAMQYGNSRATLLRLEHHPSDGSVHLHVADESDTGADFMLLPHERLAALLTQIIALQDDITLETAPSYLPRLMDIVDVLVERNGEFHLLTT